MNENKNTSIAIILYVDEIINNIESLIIKRLLLQDDKDFVLYIWNKSPRNKKYLEFYLRKYNSRLNIVVYNLFEEDISETKLNIENDLKQKHDIFIYLKEDHRIADNMISRFRSTGINEPEKIIIKEPVTIIHHKESEPLFVTVYITAYKSSKTIKRTLDSLKTQTYKGKLEILVGIDGCEGTLDTIKTYNFGYLKSKMKIYYFNKNRGTYITRNSLVLLASGDVFMSFDSDDEMLPNFIEENLRILKNNDFTRNRGIEIRDGIESGLVRNHDGVHSFNLRALKATNLYPATKVAGDTMLLRNLRNISFLKEGVITVPTFKRHITAGSLTNTVDFSNPVRKNMQKRIKDLSKSGKLNDEPIVINEDYILVKL